MGLRHLFKRTTAADIYDSLACETTASALAFTKWLEDTIADPPVSDGGSLVYFNQSLMPKDDAARFRQSVLVGAEAMYYLLHWVDRHAVSYLGIERRNTAFDKIAFLTVSTFARVFVSDQKARDRTVDDFIDTLNRRQELYGQCNSDVLPSQTGSTEFALAYHVHHTMNTSPPRDMTEVLIGNRKVTEADVEYLPDPQTAILIACFLADLLKALKLKKRFKLLYALWVK